MNWRGLNRLKLRISELVLRSGWRLVSRLRKRYGRTKSWYLVALLTVLQLIELWETYLMHLDADEEEQKAAQGDPEAVSTWSRDQPKDRPTGNVAASEVAGSDAATLVGDNESSPTTGRQHDGADAAAGDTMAGKPSTDASAFASAAADEERDV